MSNTKKDKWRSNGEQVRLSIRLSPEEHRILEIYADRVGRKKSAVIREFIHSLRRD